MDHRRGTRFYLKFLSRILQFYCFQEQSFFEGSEAFSLWKNDKTTNILMNCFLHHDILAKTRSIMTMAIAFFSPKCRCSRVRTTLVLKNLVFAVVRDNLKFFIRSELLFALRNWRGTEVKRREVAKYIYSFPANCFW